MTDDLKTIQDRIKKSIADEKSLNASGQSEKVTETVRRSAEKQEEGKELAKLKEEERRQAEETAKKDLASQEFLRQEGAVVKLSQAIQKDFDAEVGRRESAERNLREKAAALEDQLKRIKVARPS